MNLKVDGSPAAVMHRGFFNPNSTITANFKQNLITIYAYSSPEDFYGNVESFYLKTDHPLPFDLTFTCTSSFSEWDDRYDPPQETIHSQSTSVTLLIGQLESTHKFHKSGASGASFGIFTSYTFSSDAVHGEIKPSVPFTVNGNRYVISRVKR